MMNPPDEEWKGYVISRVSERLIVFNHIAKPSVFLWHPQSGYDRHASYLGKELPKEHLDYFITLWRLIYG